ncbi:MAG: isoaspartyl peptidase/L-asparaginase family protein, partial [Nitrososphaerales archaeon]
MPLFILSIDFGIVVHGGAGSFTPSSREDVEKRRRNLRNSVETGFHMLRRGKSAADAVEAAIKILEDSQVFNAGSGAALTLEGKVSTDASMMKGDLSCGSIAASNVVKNPISLARQVMEKSDHVLIVGSENLWKFAAAVGIRYHELKPAPFRLKQYRDNLVQMKIGRMDTWPKNFALLKRYSLQNEKLTPEKSDTVGAVAIDKSMKVCAGVSTGGRWLKLPGRVGDSALVGAGLYADDSSGAACATGAGEDIIRVGLCKSVCDFMRMGADAQSACDSAISS